MPQPTFGTRRRFRAAGPPSQGALCLSLPISRTLPYSRLYTIVGRRHSARSPWDRQPRPRALATRRHRSTLRGDSKPRLSILSRSSHSTTSRSHISSQTAALCASAAPQSAPHIVMSPSAHSSSRSLESRDDLARSVLHPFSRLPAQATYCRPCCVRHRLRRPLSAQDQPDAARAGCGLRARGLLRRRRSFGRASTDGRASLRCV